MKQTMLAWWLMVLLAWPVQAQGAPVLSSLEVALWPEYDRPDMLVIYRGLFSAGTPLPLPVEIRIPAAAGQPSAVAYVGEGGQRFNQAYTTRADGDWLVVSFELATPGFQLEYYAPISQGEAGRRTFEYVYAADYGVDAMILEVQVPPTAQDLAVEPAADSVSQGADGLVYHRVTYDSLAAGKPRSWSVDYQKEDSDLTVDLFASPQVQQPTPAPAAATVDDSTVLIFAVAFVALLAVGGGAFWLGRQTGGEAEPAPPPKGKRRGSGRGSRASMAGPGAVFCHRCGASLRSDSEFCHKCGAEIRT